MSALAPRSKYPTFSFDKVGVKITGVISQPTEDRQARKFGTDVLDFWPDGNPIMQTRIVLRVADGTEHAIYAKGRMAKAITAAIIAAGAEDLEVGGELTVEHHAVGEGKNPSMPPKEYRAKYVKPAASAADPDDPWADDEPPF